MAKLVIGVFVILHGLVHLLYAGQSRRLFELQPGMAWPDGSWMVSGVFGDPAARGLASVACLVAAFAFAVGGVAVLAGWPWWRQALLVAAVFSAAVFLVFWNGGLERLPDQGAVAILIDLAIVLAVAVLRWPTVTT